MPLHSQQPRRTSAARALRSAVAALPAGLLLLGLGLPADAQTQLYMLKPGSKVGPATQVKPTNCVTAADGSITCDTKLVNPPGDTPAKPIYTPFKN